MKFLTEPLKIKIEQRNLNFIIDEIKEFLKIGCKYFRLGKQSCIYGYFNGN